MMNLKIMKKNNEPIFSSPEPRALGELIGWSPLVHHQHFQRTSSLKLLGQFELNYICSLQAKGEKSLNILFRSHDQDGHYAHI